MALSWKLLRMRVAVLVAVLAMSPPAVLAEDPSVQEMQRELREMKAQMQKMQEKMERQERLLEKLNAKGAAVEKLRRNP